MRIEYHSLPDPDGKCRFTLSTMERLEGDSSECAFYLEKIDEYFADPRKYGFNLPKPEEVNP